MKKLMAIFACVCLIASCNEDQIDVLPTAEAVDTPSEFEIGTVITIAGRLISTMCFADENPEKHDKTLECGVENTQKGIPVAVVESGGEPIDAWILLTVPQIFTDYMGQEVRVTGDVRSEGVLNPTRVEWKRDEEWVFIM